MRGKQLAKPRLLTRLLSSKTRYPKLQRPKEAPRREIPVFPEDRIYFDTFIHY